MVALVKLEPQPLKSQQKCVALLALLCCCGVLLALTLSMVDFWGDYEDGVTEDNCSTDCGITLVENLPEALLLPEARETRALPLSLGFHHLLDRAQYSVEVVSPVWNLLPWEPTAPHEATAQGQYLFQRLLGLRARGVKLRIASSLTNSTELKTLAEHNAEVRFVNMSAITRGELKSSFWIVDRKHVYIGSGDMDWRSLSKRKELGVVLVNCSCLALDLNRIFSFYWQLQDRDYIPNIWSRKVIALYGKQEPLQLQLNSSGATAYVSASPDSFCPKHRSRDVEAIRHVIQSAQTFAYISVTDYLPLVNRTYRGVFKLKYWSPIDEVIREAVLVRGVRVHLLISLWDRTPPLTVNFVASLQSLCIQLHNCSLEVCVWLVAGLWSLTWAWLISLEMGGAAHLDQPLHHRCAAPPRSRLISQGQKFFERKEAREDIQHGLNHNKYIVTDNAVYIGNHAWVGREMTHNAGVGLVIRREPSQGGRGLAILEQIREAFERDWGSWYAKSLQDPDGSYRQKQQQQQQQQHQQKQQQQQQKQQQQKQQQQKQQQQQQQKQQQQLSRLPRQHGQ